MNSCVFVDHYSSTMNALHILLNAGFDAFEIGTDCPPMATQSSPLHQALSPG